MPYATRMSHLSPQDKPFVVSGALFVGAVALDMYMSMFELPLSQIELLDWVAWILSIGGVIVFFSALVNHKHHR